MMNLEVTEYYRSVSGLLQVLQEAWQNDNIKQHAETTVVALYNLSKRPGFTARSVLPTTLDFIRLNGPHGVDGILLSALSAASVYEPRNFQRAIDKLILQSSTFELEETKPNFRIGFVDFDTIPATFLPDVNRQDPWVRPSGGDKVLSGILEGLFKGRNDPDKLVERHGKIGAGIILNLLHTSFTDSARKLIGDLRTLNEARKGQVLQGFGFTIRRKAGGLDEYEEAGPGQVATGPRKPHSWRDTVKEARVVQESFEAMSLFYGMTAAVTKDPIVGGASLVLSGWSMEINRAITPVEKALEEAEKAIQILKIKQGTTEKSDEEKKKKMPLPDDVGGQTTIFDILEALKTYVARLAPYINPKDDELGGGGVTLVRVPYSGDIDPLWEEVGGSTREDDLKEWLAFLQAKLFDSLVNPVRGE